VKSFTVRLPERIVAAIEAEARARGVPKSDVVRERLEQYPATKPARPLTMAEAAADILRELDEQARKSAHLPKRNISANKKKYLSLWRYGQNRPR
jgi:hypothetical protein